jgi:hypothetical protein
MSLFNRRSPSWVPGITTDSGAKQVVSVTMADSNNGARKVTSTVGSKITMTTKTTPSPSALANSWALAPDDDDYDFDFSTSSELLTVAC